MRKEVNFLKAALKDRQIGALSRSSKYVVQGLLDKLIDESLYRVIEYGPGDGVVTKEILKRMPQSGEMIVVETNPNFLGILKKIKDPRLKIIEGRAEDISKLLESEHESGVDLVISSIPFSILNPSDRENLVSKTFNMLKTTGKLIIFHQYSTLMLKLLNKYFACSC